MILRCFEIPMANAEGESPDDPLFDALAAFDDRLAAGVARPADERGVLHRDLKPSSILLQRQSSAAGDDYEELGRLSDFEPRITDFSLAKLADGLGPDTRSGVPFGSPPYMAPEQAEGKLCKIGPAADVYGLGCILYELLTGKAPFCGETQLDTLRQVIASDPVAPRRRRRGLPVALETVVLKCLEKEPVRRYTSAHELAADLERFLAGESVKARPPGPWERLRRQARRHPAAVVDCRARGFVRRNALGRPILVRETFGRKSRVCPVAAS